jgi:hypothetical protein
VARELDATSPTPKRSNPLDNTREPATGLMVVVALAAAGLLATAGWLVHARVEQGRMRAVARAVAARGYAGPVRVQPLRGDECWRAREGFAWSTAEAAGLACAGPGNEVRLQRELAGIPEGGR